MEDLDRRRPHLLDSPTGTLGGNMSTLGELLHAEHELPALDPDSGPTVDGSTLSMAGTSYYYNTDPQDKTHKHYETSM